MKPPYSSPEFDHARRQMEDFVRRHATGSGSAEATRELGEWCCSLGRSGWNRAALFQLVHEAVRKLPPETPDAVLDALDRIHDDLRGSCAARGIERMEGEPEDRKELVDYVRCRRWLAGEELVSPPDSKRAFTYSMRPALDSDEFAAARRHLDDWLERFSARGPEAVAEAGAEFANWSAELVAAGWSRAALYRLVYGPWPESAPDYLLFDILDNYGTGLTGDCAASCIERLPGEPERYFLCYVRSRRWLDENASTF